MKIRTAQIADAPEIAQVHVHSWQAAYKSLMPDELLANLSVEAREEQWTNGISNSPTLVDVCEVGGHIVGFVAYGSARDEDAKTNQLGEVYAIYLESSAWGKGHGKALFATALGRLRDEGYSGVVLWVLDTNERAIQFYERNGFRPDGKTQQDEISAGVEVTEVRYQYVFTSEL